MSQRSRRILAMSVCTVVGAWAMLESVASLQRQGNPLVTFLLFMLALFLLLSVVGLAKPWLRPVKRPDDSGRRRTH